MVVDSLCNMLFVCRNSKSQRLKDSRHALSLSTNPPYVASFHDISSDILNLIKPAAMENDVIFRPNPISQDLMLSVVFTRQ